MNKTTQVQAKKTTELVNKKRIRRFIRVLAVICAISAFSHKPFEYDPKLETLQEQYNTAVKQRNAYAKPFLKALDDFYDLNSDNQSALTDQALLSKAKLLYQERAVYRSYDSLNTIRKALAKPLDAHVKSKQIGVWHNMKKLLHFIGIPIAMLLALMIYTIKRVYQLNDPISNKLYKKIDIYLAMIPTLFLVQAILFSFNILVDYPLWLYVIVAITLAYILSKLANSIIRASYVAQNKDKNKHKHFIKALIAHMVRTKRTVLTLAEEIINDAHEQEDAAYRQVKQNQIEDLLHENDQDFIKTLKKKPKK